MSAVPTGVVQGWRGGTGTGGGGVASLNTLRVQLGYSAFHSGCSSCTVAVQPGSAMNALALIPSSANHWLSLLTPEISAGAGDVSGHSDGGRAGVARGST